MFPFSIISNRYPFAPSALPDFIAHMDTSDFLPSTTILAFYTCLAAHLSFCTNDRISLVTAQSLCMARHDLGLRKWHLALASERARHCCLLATPYHRPSSTKGLFGAQHLQGQLHLLPFAPRHLSCLRIDMSVTVHTAKLDSRLVASDYLGRIPTYKIVRPCQAARNTSPYHSRSHSEKTSQISS